MKITELARKPQLIEVVLDDTEIRERYNDAITYWTWDRQPMDLFLKMASLDQNDPRAIIEVVRNLVLNEQGEPVLVGDVTIPVGILMKIITRTITDLGNA